NYLFSDAHDAIFQINLQIAHADDGRFAELARHESSVAGAATAAGQNTFRSEHAMHVIRLRLGPDHDHLLAIRFGPALRCVGVEGYDAHGCPRRYIEATGNGLCSLARLGIQLWVQEEVNLVGLDAAHCLFFTDQALLDHVHGDADFGLRCAFAVACLQDP